MCDRFGYQCAACNYSMHMSLNHLRMLLLNIPVIEIQLGNIMKHRHVEALFCKFYQQLSAVGPLRRFSMKSDAQWCQSDTQWCLDFTNLSMKKSPEYGPKL